MEHIKEEWDTYYEKTTGNPPDDESEDTFDWFRSRFQSELQKCLGEDEPVYLGQEPYVNHEAHGRNEIRRKVKVHFNITK